MPLFGSLIQEMEVHLLLLDNLNQKTRKEVLALCEDWNSPTPHFEPFQRKTFKKATLRVLKQAKHQALMEDQPLLKLFAEKIGVKVEAKHGLKFKLTQLWKRQLDQSTPMVTHSSSRPINRL